MKSGFQFKTKHKEILLYGFCMAALLFLLKLLEAQYIVFNYRLEFLIGSIAVIFTVLGIWVALRLVKPKVQTLIVEKEVYKESPVSAEISHQEIEKTGLSKRELEVLNLMAAGLSNEEIAGNLFVSLNTVKTHCSGIFLKLDVRRRTQAVEKAKRLKIIL